MKWIVKIFLALCLFINMAYGSSSTLQSVQVSKSGAQSQLLISGWGTLDYHVFELQQPNRLVIDFRNTAPNPSFHAQVLDHALVKSIRSSRTGHQFRLVFDLNFPVSYTLKPQAHQLFVSLTRSAVSNHSPVLNSARKAFAAPKPVYQDAMGAGTKDVVVVIDPGHGGKDTGAIGQRGTREKNDVLAISKKLQILINHQVGFKAVLTRSNDYYLTLRQRLALARRYKADLFVAIHADAFRNHRARGASVYALSQRGVTSEAARWLAERENQSELMGGVELNDKDDMLRSVLINLSQTATIQSALALGHQLLVSIGSICPLHHRSVEQAAFVVLKSPDIPSVLVECGFISNPLEEARLRDPAYQQRIATAISHGIVGYFKLNPPRGTKLARHNWG